MGMTRAHTPRAVYALDVSDPLAALQGAAKAAGKSEALYRATLIMEARLGQLEKDAEFEPEET